VTRKQQQLDAFRRVDRYMAMALGILVAANSADEEVHQGFTLRYGVSGILQRPVRRMKGCAHKVHTDVGRGKSPLRAHGDLDLLEGLKHSGVVVPAPEEPCCLRGEDGME
jgi:hypothetical protein